VKKVINTLRPGKDDLDLRTCSMYFIPCKCGKVYVCQTSRTIEIRCQEHKTPMPWPIRKICCNKKHKKQKTRNSILKNRLTRITTYMDCTVTEVIKIPETSTERLASC